MGINAGYLCLRGILQITVVLLVAWIFENIRGGFKNIF